MGKGIAVLVSTITCFRYGDLQKGMNGIESWFGVAGFSSQGLGLRADSSLYTCASWPTVPNSPNHDAQGSGYVRLLHPAANRLLCTICVLPVHEQLILRSGATEDAMEMLEAGGGVDDAVILLLEVY